MKNPKIALVYDRVNTTHGGAEYVLQVLQKLYPDTPLYTAVYNPETARWAAGWKIIPSWLNRLPWANRLHRVLVGVMPLVWESFDFSSFDIVISITSAEAKGILTGHNTLHICYLLTPTRYLWSHAHAYHAGIFNGFKQLLFSQPRMWDYVAAQRPDVIIPISALVRQRCEKYYKRRCAPVIYPPFLPPQRRAEKVPNVSKKDRYVMMVARLVPYKQIELAITTAIRCGIRLVIVGDGPDKKRLQQLIVQQHGTALIRLISNISTQQLAKIYLGAAASLVLAEEDFGIVALESQSYGCPVVVYRHSGAAEVVIDSVTGTYVHAQTVDALSAAMYSTLRRAWRSEDIIAHAELYNTNIFMQSFSAAVDDAWHHFLSERVER